MEIVEIPFNKFIGIKKTSSTEYLLELDESPDYLNHLGNIHASAQISLAEAASGEFLFRQFKDISEQCIPVVRRLETKFKKPANGKLFASIKSDKAALENFTAELKTRNRSLINVEVSIMDMNKTVTMEAVVIWYVQLMSKPV